MVILDGNEAAASVAYRLSEVVAIYPITPSSPMAEWADQWRSEGKRNIWGALPIVEELQSEGGAAGALHGALQAGAFATTFTASQGLLLMIPNMFKIAGELTPATMHVTARTLATHALSIFGDHSDVMACRSTGWAMLASNSVQEVHDLALVAQIATLESRIPFIHFFDGFRTSHEVGKILPISDDTIRALVDDKFIIAFPQERAQLPTAPSSAAPRRIPTSSSRRAKPALPTTPPFPASCSRSWTASPRRPAAPIVCSTTTVRPTPSASSSSWAPAPMWPKKPSTSWSSRAKRSASSRSAFIGLSTPRPSSAHCPKPSSPSPPSIAARSPAAPASRSIRTSSPSSPRTPPRLPFAAMPKVIGGRYGLSSKEFTPAMVKGVFDELAKPAPKNHFTIGINDDVSHSSLDYDPNFSTEDPKTVRALFYGLGSDGTVGANKNSIKIIGSETPNYAQGYFVYDSKKSGSMTTSHLRFGPNPIRSSYLITHASFVACHNFSFLEKMDVLEAAMPGAVFLLNSPYSAAEVWDKLPRSTQAGDAAQEDRVLRHRRLHRSPRSRHGHAHQHHHADLLLRHQRRAAARRSHRADQESHQEDLWQARRIRRRQELRRRRRGSRSSRTRSSCPPTASSEFDLIPSISPRAPEFVRNVLGQIAAGKGDQLPVSAIPAGGTFPTGTAQWEKRNIAQFIPVWDKDLCIQCGKCVMVCPHAVIRAKVYSSDLADPPRRTPTTLQWAKPKWKGMEQDRYTLQVAPEDCTGCAVCVEVCPVKNKSDASKKAINMAPQAPLARIRARELGLLPFASLKSIARSYRTPRSRTSSFCNRSSSSPAHAPAAARRLTSSSSPSSSATGFISPTPPAALPSTAATCPPRRTPRMPRAAVQPGPTRSLKTTPSSASA